MGKGSNTFEFCSTQRLTEVLSFVEALDLQSGGHLARESTLTKISESALSIQDWLRAPLNMCRVKAPKGALGGSLGWRIHTLAFSTSRFSFPIVFKSLVMSTLSKKSESVLPDQKWSLSLETGAKSSRSQSMYRGSEFDSK